MRCLTLAEALQDKGVQIHFYCKEHVGNLNAMLQQKGMSVTELPVSPDGELDDAEQTIQALKGDKPDWLVVDHYGLNISWEQHIRPHVGKLMVIDDLAMRKHDCDLLLDQNYAIEGEQRYKGLVSDSCKVLLGPDYGLLRKEFQRLRELRETKQSELKKILVFFTAGDDLGETLKAMHGVELFGKIESVDVVVGQANPHNPVIRKKCDELHWGFHCQVDYMPRLIAEADLVVGAGGSSNWERCALGVPAMVTILAENQAPIAEVLDSIGVVHNLGWCNKLQAKDYTNALSVINGQSLACMSKNALKLVDAKGAERVANILLLR